MLQSNQIWKMIFSKTIRNLEKFEEFEFCSIYSLDFVYKYVAMESFWPISVGRVEGKTQVSCQSLWEIVVRMPSFKIQNVAETFRIEKIRIGMIKSENIIISQIFETGCSCYRCLNLIVEPAKTGLTLTGIDKVKVDGKLCVLVPSLRLSRLTSINDLTKAITWPVTLWPNWLQTTSLLWLDYQNWRINWVKAKFLENAGTNRLIDYFPGKIRGYIDLNFLQLHSPRFSKIGIRKLWSVFPRIDHKNS